MPSSSGKSLLVLALPGIGDCLIASDSWAWLRQHLPDWRFDALTMFPSATDFLRSTGIFDTVTEFNFLSHSATESFRFLTPLRGRYEATLLPFPSNGIKYNLATAWIRAPVRVGYDYAHDSRRNLSLLNNVRIPEEGAASNRTHNFRAAAALLKVVTGKDWVPPSGHPFRPAHKPPSVLTFGFHTYSSTFKNMHRKCWPPEHFAELIKSLKSRFPSSHIKVFAGPSDQENLNLITRLVFPLPMETVSERDFTHTMSHIRNCSVFISNDSGLAHAAGALNIPTVVLYGPTDAKRLYDWDNPHRIVRQSLPCQPCFFYSSRPLSCHASLDYACIRQLPVGEVLRAVEELIPEVSGAR
ncbi:MAG: glycosyltransferase family 9 protein [Verrucomicrobiae bacterium]|nr:glycosyltransferase family 9 protein [Verrucomicrobiae bacterium]